MLEYLIGGKVRTSSREEDKLKSGVSTFGPGTSDVVLKLLALGKQWLQCYLPHCLRLVHRVHYGLLPSSSLVRGSANNQFESQSLNRRLLAVPFIGKDVPSRNSEFAHPDIAIGLTFLAYRYQGLRYPIDLVQLLMLLKERMREQSNSPYHMRVACRCFARWVAQGGGRVKGVIAGQDDLKEQMDENDEDSDHEDDQDDEHLQVCHLGGLFAVCN